MGFWTYCDKVSKIIGSFFVVKNIKVVWELWKIHTPVEDCSEHLINSSSIKLFKES